MKNDLRPHAQNLRDKTAKKSLVSDVKLKLALQNKRELEKKLAAEKFNIAKLKFQKHLLEHAESFIGLVSNKFFPKRSKQIAQKFLLGTGKKTKSSR